ncbi:hypothetical protein DDIC_13200 [Desulfovibrio desulfuricans]|uniref:Rad50/SbcC-type AAA domain-containing protein n=1 Tax=Desulfovibrio desulfuricans TaxID=876 RepID=A0A4P7ULT5_DESDE|nr:AAA family ATPase [Desulfovibrio desulfuricans]QCC86817.1 hypothetical protein DDIC_13200 [Desulfovibrio desulfuricans]
MNIKIKQLLIRTKKTTESVIFGKTLTFIYGPISKGKSTVLRLIDYCFGGDLERTPAIQQEFISTELFVDIGSYNCVIERSAFDKEYVRITWNRSNETRESVLAPISPSEIKIIDADVYNLSDLLFYLCDITPIKVKKRSRDPDSPLIRLSFRDIWWYCYLNQSDLDSSFFRFGHPFKERKSKDALKFFTGLYSERLTKAENELFSAVDEQRTKRNTANEIRNFMQGFEFGSSDDLLNEIDKSKKALLLEGNTLKNLEINRTVQKHPTDSLRVKLRRLGDEVESTRTAILDLGRAIEEQKALRAELIMTKTKAHRLEIASAVLNDVDFMRCPKCGEALPARESTDQCVLCGQISTAQYNEMESQEIECVRRDLNDRIDQIGELIKERDIILKKLHRSLKIKTEQKRLLDAQLQHDLDQYDTSLVEAMKIAERNIATLKERINNLNKFLKLSSDVNSLEEEANRLEKYIDALKFSVKKEREALNHADMNTIAIANEFKRILLAVNFPGVSEGDTVSIDTRTWKPYVYHGDIEWSFWECGSLGKKTLFNVCYALSLHIIAIRNNLPVPNVLIIDGPTKNISEYEDPKLVASLYSEIYRIAKQCAGKLQLILVDSDLVNPEKYLEDFVVRRMAGTQNEPSLISYYEGP